MKKYRIIFVAGLVMAGLTSCADSFLDTDPAGERTAGTSLSVEEAQSLLVGCYDGYQQAYCYGGAQFLIASEIMSDNCFAGGGSGDNTNFMAIDEFDRGYVSESSMMEDYWKSYYTTINRCNTLIASDASTTWNDDEATRASILGQARALRALCYFDLTRLYGKVPLLTEPSVARVKEAEPSEIFELIASDLKFAADNIAFGAYNDAAWSATNNGLISEWAAKALLARVYLFYTGYYGAQLEAVTESEVKAGLESIINNGGFDLLEDFSALWPAASRVAAADGSHAWTTDNYAGETNKEIVFNLKFDSNLSQGTNQNGMIAMCSMRNTTFAPYATGWGVCSVNPSLYTTYLPADKRRDASIINLTAEGITASDKFNSGNDWREYTGYSIKKYSATGFNDGTRWIEIENPGAGADWQYKESQDMVVVRYADVLLMAAEMGCSNAQDCFDKVRDRAFGGDTNYRRSLTKDNILEERRLEFAFEGLRYWDLLRLQGLNAAAATLAANQNGTSVKTAGVDATVNFSADNMIQKQGLLLKPQNQITLMGTEYLTQNTGW